MRNFSALNNNICREKGLSQCERRWSEDPQTEEDQAVQFGQDSQNVC